MGDLKTCLFCTHDDAHVTHDEPTARGDRYPHRRYFVLCACCESTGPAAPTPEKAATAWNEVPR